jgi:hypothetical protein
VSREPDYRPARPGRFAATPVMEPSAAGDATDQAVTGGRAEEFLAMSALLTGYGRVQLAGTGLTRDYLRAIDAALPAGVLDDLFAAFGRVLAQSVSSSDGVDAYVAPAILDHPRLGPVARNIILLWYCGTWTALPEEWHASYGASSRDVTHVVSAQAYQGALQWTAAGAHPAGARPQGFGAWSVPPESPVSPETPVAPERTGT